MALGRILDNFRDIVEGEVITEDLNNELIIFDTYFE